MGVKNLWDILESCKQILPLHHLRNKRLCVDLSCWIIQLHSACRGKVHQRLYLRGLFHRLRALIALNCSIILVSDGSIPALKLSTYKRRLGFCKVAEQNKDSDVVSSLHRNMGSAFSNMIKEAKLLGLALGVPCLDGLEEAEAQCALLNSENICDGCFSADSDAFLFGARTVFRDIVLGDDGHVVCYDMLDIETRLGFGRNSLISLALILGSDYSQGLQGLGPEAACRIVKSVGDAHILCQIASGGFQFRKAKGRKNTNSVNTQADRNSRDECTEETTGVQNLRLKSQFSRVVDAYMMPKCHAADSEVVQRACCQYPFQRFQLHDICANFFSWKPEKTDEYILPKIAERDLRRYASLRTSLSLTGVPACLEEMPVPCPVASVLQRRQVRKKECFEVSWQGVEGLKTSVVPADLLQCACPEKITEFLERKNVKKWKQDKRSKPRKEADKVTLNEIDLRLQNLLISIQSDKNNPAPYIACGQSTRETNRKPNVIDLLSPSPSRSTCKMAKLQQCIYQNAVHKVGINLSRRYSDPLDGEGKLDRVCGNNAPPSFIDLCSDKFDASCIPEVSKPVSSDDHTITIDLCCTDSDASDINDPDTSTPTVAVRHEFATRYIDIIDVSDSDRSPQQQRKTDK